MAGLYLNVAAHLNPANRSQKHALAVAFMPTRPRHVTIRDLVILR
jgi:hypothetical protein